MLLIALLIGMPFAHAQHGTVSTSGTGTAGVHIESDATYPDVTVKTGNTTTGSFRILNSANAELLRVTGIGSVTVAAGGGVGVGGTVPPGYQFYATTASVGVPTGFQFRSSYGGTSRSYIGNFGGWGTYISTNRDPRDGAFYEAAAAPNQKWAAQITLGDVNRYPKPRMFQIINYDTASGSPVETPRVIVDYDGRVGIGMDPTTPALLQVAGGVYVTGDVVVNGNIGAKFQDVAEWVPASSNLHPGTVVVLNPVRDNEVMASTRAYDTTVAGVVSEQPGLILGEGAATKETVATMGRVRVRVDARRAPIAIGDLLVTSDRAGYAMKSIPVNVAGMAMHRPGTIIGKALQPLAEGEGEILVLLSMQ